MYPTIESLIGNTPLIQTQRIKIPNNNQVLLKLEGNNPAGSVKDRPALNMILAAERQGVIHPGDRLIEATSGNTGIALAMVAAIKGYRMTLIMPDNLSQERRDAMQAYGAELILVTQKEGMEGARDLAEAMSASGQGVLLDQFSNTDNPAAHVASTGPEIWQQTKGTVTHFVSAMGTTGTIMGTSEYLKGKNANIQVVGLQPEEGASIPGIRRWPKAYMPKIFDPGRVDMVLDISQEEAESMTRALAKTEGIFCGVSSGGAVAGALKLAEKVHDSIIVTVICDRGDRYLSTGIFSKT